MHLGNGAITPECAVLTASVAAAGLGFAAAGLRRNSAEKQPWLLAGALGAAVFAAQMINFPVLPYASGHFVGGVLLAVVLRPALGALTMSVILLLQAFLLGDGGVAALGANIINMALVPATVVAAGRAAKSPALAGIQAAVATLLAAALVVIEVAIARQGWHELPLSLFASQMLLAHAAIGAVEGLLTFAMVGAISRVASPARVAAFALGAATILLAVIPFASALPDGYEASAERSAWQTLLEEAPSAMTGIPSTIAAWQLQITDAVATILPGEYLAGITTTLLAFAACCLAAWACSRGSLSPMK